MWPKPSMNTVLPRLMPLGREVYDAIIVGVAHEQFKTMGAEAIRALGKPEHVVYDLEVRDAARRR